MTSHSTTLRDGETSLESIRLAELDLVSEWFVPGSTVLELGGGSGYQARLLAARGCRVMSVDLHDRARSPVTYSTVVSYDGVRIPSGDAAFDIVFSSNVLEHVRRLDALLGEIRRVVKPGGVVVHVLPSATWRMWTSLLHYVSLVQYATGLRRRRGDDHIGSLEGKVKSRGILYLLRRALLAGPHGEYPSALSELYYFSAKRWKRVFTENGFRLVKVIPSGIYHSGSVVLPRLGMASRRRLSRLFGSSSGAFVMRLDERRVEN